MNATKVASNALATIKRNGTTYSIKSTTVTPNGSSPWKTGSTSSSTQTVNGILNDFTASQRDGTIVQDRDRRYLISASGITTPSVGDELTDGSDTMRVQSVETIRAKSTDVIHYLHVRI